MSASTTAARPLAAEFLGTAGLLAVVVGSGVMAQRLAGGNNAVALLANALATGFGLYVLITVMGPVSGAHFNPVVTVSAWLAKDLAGRRAVAYITMQLAGAIAGVWLAHLMFDLAIMQASGQARDGTGQFVSEVVATAGLMMTIAGSSRHAPAQLPAAVGAYIAAAYWFTASTSFANPAVTVARAMTDTFAGIAPGDAPLFIVAQLCGLAAGLAINKALFSESSE